MIFSWIVSSEFKYNMLMPDCNVSEPYGSLGAFLNDDGRNRISTTMDIQRY